MKDVLIVGPQQRDRDAVAGIEADRRFRTHLLGGDLDDGPPPDLEGLLREADRIAPDAVVGTKDRSALLAALVTGRRGLAGPDPQAIVRCQHKPTSRALQQAVAPEATPRFAVLGEGLPPFGPPWFLKPKVGRLSQDARRVDSEEELRAWVSTPSRSKPYAAGWRELAAAAGDTDIDAEGFIVEELVSGDEVTLEGYVHAGRVTVVGITDSVKYPGTNSFERFEYPTALPVARQEELTDLAARLVRAHGFDGGFFNMEVAVPDADAGAARIIEINARLASQFSLLVRALHGRPTYDALFALACGSDPNWKGGRPDGVAVSYVLRVFEDAEVLGVPEAEPGIEILVRPGRRLSEQSGPNDAASFRLAIAYAAGRTRKEAVARAQRRAEALRFELGP